MASTPSDPTPPKTIADDDPWKQRWAELTALAVKECGSQEQASLWLHTPKLALQWRTPLQAMATKEGCVTVEKLLRELNQ